MSRNTTFETSAFADPRFASLDFVFSFQRVCLFPPLDWRKMKQQIAGTYWIYKLIFESIVFKKSVPIKSNTNWLRPSEIPWKILEKYRSSHQRCYVRKDLKRPACNFIKKETLARCFPKNFAKFLRTPFLQNTSGRLLLEVVNI